MSNDAHASSGTERDDLQLRWHFINQCSALESLSKSSKEALKRDKPMEAKADLHEMRGRLQSVLEDLDECSLDTDTERDDTSENEV